MKSRFCFIIALAVLVLGATALPVVSVYAPITHGLLGRYWKDSFFGVDPLIYDDWDWYDMPPPGPYPQPDVVQTDLTINFKGTVHPPEWNWRPFGEGHQFSVKWTGFINIPKDGTYWFQLTSDDGSWLFIDNTLVVNNSGWHGPSAVYGSILLTAGAHEIVIDFYETADTECGIVFEWIVPLDGVLIWDGVEIGDDLYVPAWEIVPSDVLVPEPLPNPGGGVPEFSLAVPLATSLATVIYLAIRKRIGKNLE